MDLLDVLKEKRAVLSFLVETMKINSKVAVELIDKCKPYSDGLKILELMEVVSNQATQLEKISTILSIYVSSSNFNIDMANKLNEIERGEEALNQMFKNKLGGK